MNNDQCMQLILNMTEHYLEDNKITEGVYLNICNFLRDCKNQTNKEWYKTMFNEHTNEQIANGVTKQGLLSILHFVAYTDCDYNWVDKMFKDLSKIQLVLIIRTYIR